MKKHWQPIVALLVLSPLLTELLTNSAPASVFFRPGLFLLFITLGYGFPVLVIREIAFRKKLGLLGLFPLGVIYGLYNEGLFARTIINPFHSPIDTFATYGLAGDLRVPWALAITYWHALHAVIYPIIFVTYLFPAHSQESWISRKTAWTLGPICLAVAVLAFFSGPPKQPRGSVPDFLVMLVCSILLWLISKRLARFLQVSPATNTPVSWKSAGIGSLIFLVMFFMPILLSKAVLPPVLYFCYFIVLSLIAVRIFARIQEVSPRRMVFIGLGAKILVALFSLLISLPGGKTQQAASSAVFLIVFLFAILRMGREKQVTSSV